uniref:SPOR domain-containing protein n=1 Tax=Chlorobium chlorochromatii (strain CaD3) TaxID=340177 RepID=Q3AQY3_CHLCH
MQKQHIIFLKLSSLATGCLLAFSLLAPPTSVDAAATRSYARDITSALASNNVERLKSLQDKLTVPAEKLVVEALLTEDGAQAQELYQKQLSLYPDAALDQVSRSRLVAFAQAQERAVALTPSVAQSPKSSSADSAAPAVKPVVPPPAPIVQVPVQPAATATVAQVLPPQQPQAQAKGFTLRFGSFKSEANAQTFASDVNRYAPTEIVLLDGLYRVQLSARYATAEEARKVSRAIPMQSLTVSAQ